MSQVSSAYQEVLVRLVPAVEGTTGALPFRRSLEAQREALGAYDVVVYSDIPLPGFDPPGQLPPGCPLKLAGKPVVGFDRLELGRSRYEEYLAAFLQREKAPIHMRHQLIRLLPSGVEALTTMSPQPGAWRVWWSSAAPELEEFPWELLLAGGPNWASPHLSFVRGLPPDPVPPLIPVMGRPRLALIGPPEVVPPRLWDALQGVDSLEVEVMTNEPREALARAATEGFELVHLVADGFVSQAYEAALYFHGLPNHAQSNRALLASELASLLRGSQVAAIGLTVPNYDNPDGMPLAGREVPSAFRAYAHLAGAAPSLPTIVAPLGPLDPAGQPSNSDRLTQFWTQFYRGLGESFSVEEGLRRGREQVDAAPVAVFLRQPLGQLFQRAPQASREEAVAVTQKAAEYTLSTQWSNLLRSWKPSDPSLSESLDAFLEGESAHQVRLASELEPWTRPEGGIR